MTNPLTEKQIAEIQERHDLVNEVCPPRLGGLPSAGDMAHQDRGALLTEVLNMPCYRSWMLDVKLLLWQQRNMIQCSSSCGILKNGLIMSRVFTL